MLSRALSGVYTVLGRRLPELEPLACITRAVTKQVPAHEQPDVQALVVEELRRLHEGVLARYGLRPSDYSVWKAAHWH